MGRLRIMVIASIFIASFLVPSLAFSQLVTFYSSSPNDHLLSNGSSSEKNGFYNEERKLLVIKPTIIDAGVIKSGESTSRDVLFENNAERMIHWYLDFQSSAAEEGNIKHLYNTRYISFFNPNCEEETQYTAPKHFGRTINLAGQWLCADGYPRNEDEKATLEMLFNGTGISLDITALQGEGQITYILDGRQEGSKLFRGGENANMSLVQGLPFGTHHLLLRFHFPQSVHLQGFRIQGARIKRAPREAVRILPMSGRVIANASENARIHINTKGLQSGLYNQFLLLNYEEKDITLEVYFEVTEEDEPNLIPVYRYQRGNDHLLTAALPDDLSYIETKGYRSDGSVVFSLFPRETPGTLPLSRLVSTTTDNRYYFVENQQHRAPHGYVYECDIGNIATSRLAGTRPLYRWFSRAENRYFFTTSSNAEGLRRRGYVFEEIVGYVK